VYFRVCISECVFQSVYFRVCISECVFQSVYFRVCISEWTFQNLLHVSEWAFQSGHFRACISKSESVRGELMWRDCHYGRPYFTSNPTTPRNLSQDCFRKQQRAQYYAGRRDYNCWEKPGRPHTSYYGGVTPRLKRRSHLCRSSI
jgi:hypothetical protein